MMGTIRTSHEIVGARSGAAWSPADLAGALEGCLPVLVGRLPAGKRWWLLAGSGARLPAYGASELERQLIASMPGRPSELRRGAPAYEVLLGCSSEKREVLSTRVAVFQRGAPRLTMSISPGEGSGWDGASVSRERLASVLSQFARTLGIEQGSVLAGVSHRDPAPGNGPRVGWLTYLSKSRGPLPPIPPPTEVVAVDDQGWILVAQPEPVDPSNKDHLASLAYVRHALGARVLLDGPSFPPPAKPTPAESRKPEVVVLEMVAAPLVPSYLRAAPAAVPGAVASLSVPLDPSPAPSAQAPAPVPSPVTKPFSSETADIDISRLVRTSLPFDPNARPAREPEPAKPAPSATPAPSAADTGTTTFDTSEILQRSVPFAPARPAAGFGETEEFSLASLLKSGPAVPFEKTAAPAPHAPAPPPAEPLPAATPGRGRWIRFNPQTGEPLASPYWEGLPQPDRK